MAYSSTPPRRQQRPRRIEQLRLGVDQRGDVGFAPMQQDVGLPTDDAGRAARCIDQDRVVRHAVPPRVRSQRVGSLRIDGKSEPREGLLHAPHPTRIDVERGDAQRRVAFGEVRALAAGRL